MATATSPLWAASASASIAPSRSPSRSRVAMRPHAGQARSAAASCRAAGGGNGASVNGGSSQGAEPEEQADGPSLWEARGLPEYMQQGNIVAFREHSDEAQLRRAAEAEGVTYDLAHVVWTIVRRETARDALDEPLLSSFLHACILSHATLEDTLAFVLSKRLASPCFLATELFETFSAVLSSQPGIMEAAVEDLRAVYQRDPACISYSGALLHFKGYHAIQAHRIAHELWRRGELSIACALQSRMSEVFAADIHPGARFGKGILLDHGTGVVIGETAVVGDNVSILHNVTLGGTGKEDGDRHPKISDNVLIGACARVLGNIRVGRGAQVAAGALVLREVPPRTLVAGAPAREIGAIAGNPALDMDQIQAAAGDSGTGSGVAAVTSDRAAQKRWGRDSANPPEYLI